MPGSSYLVDTNILLRLVQPDSPEYGTIWQCTDRLWAQGADLFYTSQNLAEFWNVCTRPADRMVASMRVHGIANLLTLNAKDFRRFSGITVLSPDEVLASFS
jgi:predicted nucleic acid-binding protein